MGTYIHARIGRYTYRLLSPTAGRGWRCSRCYFSNNETTTAAAARGPASTFLLIPAVHSHLIIDRVIVLLYSLQNNIVKFGA